MSMGSLYVHKANFQKLWEWSCS